MDNSQINKNIVEKSLKSFDWEDLLKMYKILGIKVGAQPIKIDGVKKEKNSSESIRKELETVLTYVIDNDIPELKYGPWIIYWVNGEWEMEIESEHEGGEPLIVPIMESKMEIHFIPQSSTIKELLDINMEDDYEEEISDAEQEIIYFESRLKKAIDSEDWMVASRLRDLIEEIKKSENEN